MAGSGDDTADDGNAGIDVDPAGVSLHGGKFALAGPGPRFIPFACDLPDGRFTHIGRQAVPILGYPRDAWLEPGFWLSHVHPDDRDRARGCYDACARTGEDRVVEYRMLGADGHPVWLRSLVSPVVDAAGRAVGLSGMMLSLDAELQALRESERRFRDFADSSSDWFWETDENHTYTWVSDTTKTKIGVEPGWILGQRRTDIADATLDPAAWEEHKRRLAAREPFRGLVMRVNLPAGPRWVRSSGVPVFDSSGRFRGYRGTGSDVTAQVEAEEQSRRALELFETAIESLPIGFSLYDADDRFVTCNSQTLQMMGPTAVFAQPGTPFEDIVRSAIDAGFIPAALEDPEGYVRWRMAKHRNPEGPIEVADKDRWLQIHESHMPDGGTVTIHSDITARVLAEQETERMLALFRSAIDSIPAGFALFDADDRFVTCNEPYRTPENEQPITIERGTPFETLIRGAVEKGLIVDALDDPEGWIKRRLEMHRNPQGPFELERKNRWLRIQESRMPDGGTVIVLTDITVEKQREEQLRQTQKMDALGKLTGGLAHDFNNLLAVIAGNIELVAEELGDRPGLLRKIEAALRASARGSTLTRSLLAFARQQPLQRREVDLNRMVQDMSELIRRTMPANILIRFVPDENVWPCATDAGLLQNALLNLMVNARDAMPDGGTVTITTATQHAGAEDGASDHGVARLKAGDYAVLSISDTGTGMAQEAAERAFEPFFTEKPVGKGTGLGLAMVYGFARQSGGVAAIESAIGRGTTVRLWLPRWQSDTAPAGLPADAVRRTALGAKPGEKVLVVEDDPDLLTLVASQLQTLGYRTEQAESGAEGLERIDQDEAIAVLLTDIMLAGGMRGTLLAQRARALRPGLRVVFMSGYTEETVTPDALTAMDARLLHKPFTLAALGEALACTPGGGEPGTQRPE